MWRGSISVIQHVLRTAWAPSLWTGGGVKVYSSSLVHQQPWADAQSRVGSSVMRLRCWLTAAERLILPVVTQQRVNTRLTVMIITSVLELEKLKWLHDHVRLCCQWTDCWARTFRTIHMDFSKTAAPNFHRNPDLYLFVQFMYDIYCYASWCVL